MKGINRMRTVCFGFVFLLMTGTALSQSFTGTIDGYYSGNFNDLTRRTNALRAFDIRNNEFSLNYAELAIEDKSKPVGYRVDLGFGDAAGIVNSFEPSTTAFLEHLQQAYMSLSKENLTVDFGKFVTPLGAEVIETKDNWNYSRSFLFNYAVPLYHFGVRAMVAANDKVSIGATATNGWNNVRDNNAGKTIGIHSVIKPVDKLSWAVNYMFGDELGDDVTRHTFDSTLTLTANDRVSVMGNYDYLNDDTFGGAKLHGVALYGKLKAHDKVVISPRWEWLQDKQGLGTGTSQTLREFTLTTAFPLDDRFTLYGEYRHDRSTEDVFAAAGDLPTFTNRQNTLTIGAVFTVSK